MAGKDLFHRNLSNQKGKFIVITAEVGSFHTANWITYDIYLYTLVWWKVMFPVIRVSSHSVHVVNYIEELIK